DGRVVADWKDPSVIADDGMNGTGKQLGEWESGFGSGAYGSRTQFGNDPPDASRTTDVASAVSGLLECQRRPEDDNGKADQGDRHADIGKIENGKARPACGGEEFADEVVGRRTDNRA